MVFLMVFQKSRLDMNIKKSLENKNYIDLLIRLR